MNLPTVTIGLPVYNGERFLEEAIESVLSQTHTDLELVIADNASTDSTEGICRHFESMDSRVHYLRNDANLGAARNYNLTLERARGRYFKWLAHDDVCKPDFIRVCVEALGADPEIVLAYPTPVDIDEHGVVLGLQDAGLGLDNPDPVQRFRDALDQPHTALPVFGLTRTDVLRHTGQHGNYPAADRVLLAELTLWGKLHEIPEKLYLHREHDQRFVHTHRSDKDRVAWFDPSRKGEVFFTQWRELREYVNAVRRAPLTERQRITLQAYLSKWMFAKRRNLAGEFKAGLLLRLRGPSE
jgi:glycosyltransferase involved in cell wall biosynthesis